MQTWLIDAVLALTLLEGLGLWAWHRRTGQGLPPGDYALNLLSGLCLMVALRAVATGLPWPATALCLMAAGSAHAADLWRRHRARR